MTYFSARAAAQKTVRGYGDFEVGSIVRIRDDIGSRGLSEPAVIKLFYTDIEGGFRLDREVFGFKSWNIDNAELVEGQ